MNSRSCQFYVTDTNNYKTYVFADDLVCKRETETHTTQDKERKRIYNTEVKKRQKESSDEKS